MAFEEGSGDFVIDFVGDKMVLSRVSFLDGVLLFVGCWREGDLVYKRERKRTKFHKNTLQHIIFLYARHGKRRSKSANKSIFHQPSCRFLVCRLQFQFCLLFATAPVRFTWHYDMITMWVLASFFDVITERASSSITVLFAMLFNIERLALKRTWWWFNKHEKWREKAWVIWENIAFE